MIRKRNRLAGLFAALFFVLPAQAQLPRPDSASVESGRGNEATDLWRAGVAWNWDKRWFAERSWTLGAYWDLQLGRWSGTRAGANDEIWDLGFTPVFRLERARRSTWFPYAEAAIGFHLLSELRINRARSFSSKFQFGDHIGLGVRYGERYRYDLSLRLQHLSNGGLSEPNPGINFLQLRLAYHFK